MSLHIEVSLVDPSLGLIRAGHLVQSQTLASAGVISGVLVPNDGRPYVMRLVAEAKMFVAVSQGEPNAGADPRRVILANEELIMAAPPGARVVWAVKP